MGFVAATLGAITTVAASLPQTAINRGFALGTLVAPTLPDFLTNSPLPKGFPWGADTVFNTDPLLAITKHR
jgi:hypothetical protein